MTNSASTMQDGGAATGAAEPTSARKSSARGSAKAPANGSRRRSRPGPRQRLLESATKLFTTEGIRVIGIDRILRDADVAKASLYSLFGSKDNLVVAYIEELDQDWRRRWEDMCADRPKPEDRILAFFDMAIADEPAENFRGSHFQNAASEYPRPETDSEHRIRGAALEHRRWCRDTMADLLTEKFGYASRTLADQLMVFLDGGIAGSKMSRTVSPMETARELAKQLLFTAPIMYSI